MLQRVRIKNFRCLREVDVPLRPLTVLIGPNDSGKSAFLRAIEHLCCNKGFDLTDFWRMDPKHKTLVSAESSTERIARGTGLLRPEGGVLHPYG